MATNDTALEHPVHDHEINEAELWTGAQSPFNVSYGKLMMWYFLLSDAFTSSSVYSVIEIDISCLSKLIPLSILKVFSFSVSVFK
jgi:hypothetical protein